MSPSENDPTAALRLAASRYRDVDEGTSCTQSSFKTGKNAFLYIGMQGGRYKAMFKLQESRSEAIELAEKDPDHYEVGTTAWVTARFSADAPMPTRRWKRWLDESHALSLSTPGAAKKRATTKKAAKKKAAKKKRT